MPGDFPVDKRLAQMYLDIMNQEVQGKSISMGSVMITLMDVARVLILSKLPNEDARVLVLNACIHHLVHGDGSDNRFAGILPGLPGGPPLRRKQ